MIVNYTGWSTDDSAPSETVTFERHIGQPYEQSLRMLSCYWLLLFLLGFYFRKPLATSDREFKHSQKYI